MIDRQTMLKLPGQADELVDRFQPPLSEAMLRRWDFFELYPPDIIGMPDLEYGELVGRTQTIEPGGRLPNLDWHQYERWRTAENTSVLNRCYFIASLARYAWLGKDRTMARLLVDTMLHFVASCPPPDAPQDIAQHIRDTLYLRHHSYNLKTYDEIQKDETDIRYIWFDFQPASRLMHFAYALYFLRGLDVLDTSERSLLCRSLYEHAEVIYHGEQSLPLEVSDNHQSTRAAALMMGAAFFKGIGLWRSFAEEAARIIAFHSRESFFADGVLKEISPSYHTSVAWHVRDCCLLAKQNAFSLPDAVSDQLANAVAYIESMTAPNGKTVVIDDGREVAPGAWLDAMGDFRSPAQASKTSYFPDAGLATLRRPGLFLVFDASVFTGEITHYQGGKNGLILWSGGRPFLVDSGSPDLYDDEWFSKWYKQPQAHSTLLVDGVGDAQLKGFTEFVSHAVLQCDGWHTEPDGSVWIEARHESTDPTWEGVTWSRRLNISPDDIVDIEDQVHAQRAVTLTFLFNLHHEVELGDEVDKLMLSHGDQRLAFSYEANHPVTLERSSGRVYADSDHHLSSQIHLTLDRVQEVRLHTQLTPMAT